MNKCIRFLVSPKLEERLPEDVKEKEDVMKGREGKPPGYKTNSTGITNLVGWLQ